MLLEKNKNKNLFQSLSVVQYLRVVEILNSIRFYLVV